MTKSTITREQLEEWVAQFDEDGGCDATDRQLEALIRQSLAAMGSKPVAYISKSDFDAGYPHILARRDFNKACTMAVYAAQPAPVVPELRVDWQENEFSAGWNACRAAMLQELKKSAGTEAICRSDENVQVLHTKSPAQSDCCPAQNHVSPAQNGDTPAQNQGWIPVSERMPEMGEKQRYVLAADFKNNYWPNIPNTQVGVYGDWFDDGNPTWDDGDGEDLHLKEVTHWMPLPNPPKEEK